MKLPPSPQKSATHLGVAAGLASACLVGLAGQAQTLPAGFPDRFNELMGARVEALNVLGGDYGISGGHYDGTGSDSHKMEIDVSKFGGAGDVGDPRPFGNSSFAWQPRVQGSMGYAEAKDRFYTGPQVNDENKFETFAIQFGGGARFWYGEHISLAPTIMGMYGHTRNSYTPNNPVSRAAFPTFKSQNLVDWDVDTWTIRPGAQLAFNYTWRRIIFTLSSDFAYYHTESFESSSDFLDVNGDSEALKNKIDIDIPLGVQVFGHELRTGGYFARSEFFDNLKKGLNTDHMYDIHGRLVLDFLGELWKVQWLGIGASYLWGSNFHGFTIGADVEFRF